jgi:hypothetical protein
MRRTCCSSWWLVIYLSEIFIIFDTITGSHSGRFLHADACPDLRVEGKSGLSCRETALVRNKANVDIALIEALEYISYHSHGHLGEFTAQQVSQKGDSIQDNASQSDLPTLPAGDEKDR